MKQMREKKLLVAVPIPCLSESFLIEIEYSEKGKS
jgi:hypothetical protein